LRDDAGEDDERNAVADATGGNLLAEPHQEDGAADERDDCGDTEEPAGIHHNVAGALKTDGDAIGLQRGENHRAVARILVHRPAALLAFLLQLFQVRRDGDEQLHDDRCRDVRHDVQRENRHALDGAARKHVEHAEQAGLLLPKNFGERLGIDPRNGNVGAESVDQQRAEREPNALLELVGLGESRKIEVGNQLFCGGNHAGALFSVDLASTRLKPACRSQLPLFALLRRRGL
jgi:hypothetical protein